MQERVSVVMVGIAFVALLIFANSQGMLTGGTEVIHTATTPVSLFFSQFSQKFSGFFNGIFSLSKLQRENGELRDNVNKLQAELAQLSEAKKENEDLQRQLGFTTTHNFSYEAAEVIAFDPSNVRGMVTINKGQANGLKAGMAVISDGFLVGRVSEATEKTAKVQLVVDPTSAIPVTLQSANTNGIAKGEIGFGLTMDKIPQGEQIKEGDLVITSGLGGDIPKGLILGTVERITRQENSLFVTASVRPSATLGNLFRLIVIKG
jgi:rod shape-determining protein MreC